MNIFVKKQVSLMITLVTLSLLLGFGTAFSATLHDYPERMLSRGEAVDRIVKAFDLRKNYSSFIVKCLANADDCFFVFAAMSDFEGISFNPLKLYPDINPNYRYYESVNVASILGLVHGYLEDDTTPFKPEIVISRIQALKIVLGAAELMKWKERFEAGAIEESIFSDIDESTDGQWWYARYANFALLNGLIDESETFRPDEPVRLQELMDLIEKTQQYPQNAHDDSQAVS